MILPSPGGAATAGQCACGLSRGSSQGALLPGRAGIPYAASRESAPHRPDTEVSPGLPESGRRFQPSPALPAGRASR